MLLCWEFVAEEVHYSPTMPMNFELRKPENAGHSSTAYKWRVRVLTTIHIYECHICSLYFQLWESDGG